MKFRHILIGLLCWSWSFLPGQSDTLILLPKVEIEETSLRNSAVGLQLQTWNEKQLENSGSTNLGDLLSRESNIYIKSYGGNSLATSSIRGASAGQTLLLWNGLPMQSPMLGLQDFSLIPLLSAEQVTVQTGGSSALWGSGAVGGAIRLENKIDFHPGFSALLDSRIGAFGYWQQSLQGQLGNQKFQSRTKISLQHADNDFTYRVSPDLPARVQEHATSDQQHFLQDLYYKIRPNQTIAFHFWRMRSDRQLPPTTTQDQSKARQEDRSNRFLIRWQLNQDQWITRIKVARFGEKIRFTDPLIALDAPSQFQTWMTEAQVQRSIGDQQDFIFGAIYFHTTATADGYPEQVRENRTDLFASYRVRWETFDLQASLRQSLVNDNYSPIVPSLGLDYRPNQQWHLHVQVSRNNRWPTLNDRYWVPGGNPALRPEQGWSQELGIAWNTTFKNHTLQIQSTVFNRHIRDWVLWIPADGFGFWSANNIAKVWSRGLENSLQHAWKKSDWSIKSRIAYDLIRSTNQVALTLPRIDRGQQLIYTPVHQGFLDFQLAYKGASLQYRQQYTGSTRGVNEVVPAFNTGRLQIAYLHHWETYSTNCFLSVYNLWNEDYQVIERRPMPGRHVQLGIRIKVKKDKPTR